MIPVELYIWLLVWLVFLLLLLSCAHWRSFRISHSKSFRYLQKSYRIFIAKGCILPLLIKSHFWITKNCRSITLTSITAKIYYALLLNRIEAEIDNIFFWKNQNDFRRNRSATSQILTIRRIIEWVRTKNLEATLLFVNFSKVFDSILRGKMEQILAYDLLEETVTAIMVLDRNTKVKVRSPDRDTDSFDIIAGDL